MSFLDVFLTERNNRELYGVSPTDNAAKLLILSYFLTRVSEPKQYNQLMLLFQKYNRGSQNYYYVGNRVLPDAPSTGTGLTETFSRVLEIPASSLSGVGTIEEQVAEYINNNNITKQGSDAEFWVEIV